MQYYSILTKNPAYVDHLKSEQRVVYSINCRGKSMSYPQDHAAIFSGLCSNAIKKATEEPKSLIAVWKMNELSIDSEIYPAVTYKQISCNSWTVKIADTVEANFYEQRKAKIPNETGGVLIGAYDFERKVCYIVDLIPSPDDSIESPNSYIRGSNGLQKRVCEIEEITAGNLVYIGEWHSHPNNATEQSSDDKALMRSIVDYNAAQSSPGCMVIVGETHFSVYLEVLLCDEKSKAQFVKIVNKEDAP